MDTKEYAKKLLDEHIEELENNKEQYILEFGNGEQDIVSLIETIDIDSREFNVGFEQGYMFALRALIDNK